MINKHSPAAPFVNHQVTSYEDADYHYGLTKLETASLMIAQGIVSKYNMNDPEDQDIIAKLSVQLGARVLEEANK